MVVATEALLGIGAIGLLLGLSIAGLGLFHASSAAVATKHPGYAFLVALLFFGILNACTESSMMSVSFYTYLLASGLFSLALKPVDVVSPAPNRFA